MDVVSGLSENTLKNLSDKSVEKRKIAAQELQEIIEELVGKKNEAEIAQKIKSFKMFTEDDNSQRRRTGLYGLSAITVALYQKVIELTRNQQNT
jgi:polyhydroxyalkanoate synthesis regulator phasin